MEEGIPKTVEWYRDEVGETYAHLKDEELKVK